MKPELCIYLDLAIRDDAIKNLNYAIAEENIPGLLTRLEKKDIEVGTMSGSEYFPLVKMLLGNTVVAAGVKGLFDVLKKHLEIRALELKTLSEIEKAKINAGKIELKLKEKNGKVVSLTLTEFDEKERKKYNKLIDHLLKS